MHPSILVYDLECDHFKPELANPKLLGCLSSKFKGFKYTSSVKEMVTLIHDHDIIVGYNIKGYDNQIMSRMGCSFTGKVIVDLYEVADKRKSVIKIKGKLLDRILTDRSMDTLSLALDGPRKLSGDVDYDWFKQDFTTLSNEIQTKALAYLQRDIEMTEHIYQFMEEYFKDFQTYLPQEQNAKKQYLTSSVASFTYKVLCNLAGVEEVYGDDIPQDYGGGYVALPDRLECSGDIYCFDYNSLYPHIMIMCNLYGRVTEGGWKGSGISTSTGTYDNEQLAPVGEVLKDLYNKRLMYKKAKDSKEYTIKIIINTIYGLLGKSVFTSVNDFVAAADCTRLGRQWVKAARLHFKEHGYDVLYTDTDSVYLRDPFKNKKKLLEIKDKHIADIKNSVPFPVNTFDMGIDDEISYMRFVKSTEGYLKKNYIYLTKDNRVIVKGMQIIKSTATPLGREIFTEYIETDIKTKHSSQYPKSQILQWIFTKLNSDKSKASVLYKVKSPDAYKSPTQLQRMIAEHSLYGQGERRFIKVHDRHPKGVGVNGNYVGIEFADEIKAHQIIIDKIMHELEPFMVNDQKSLGGWL